MVTSTDPWTFHAMTYSDSAGVWGPGSLGGSSHGVGINRSGQIAGWSHYQWGFDSHAFVWTPGQGIVGQGRYRDDIYPRAFKLTPRPIDVVPPVIVAVWSDPSVLWPANLQMVQRRRSTVPWLRRQRVEMKAVTSIKGGPRKIDRPN